MHRSLWYKYNNLIDISLLQKMLRSWGTLKRHISLGVFVVYIDTGSPVPNIPLKSCGLADENKKTFDGMEIIRNKHIKCVSIITFTVTLIVKRLESHQRKGAVVIGFTTTCAIGVYHHLSCEFQPRSWRVALDTHYVIKYVSDLQQVGGFSGYFVFLHQ